METQANSSPNYGDSSPGAQVSGADFPFSRADFRPHPLLRNAHLQTIVSSFFPTTRSTSCPRPHRVDLPDGDAVVLHDDAPANWRPGNPVALLVHGLCGCHQAGYLVRLMQQLHAQGLRTFRMDMRGCGAAWNLSQGITHAGRSEDLLAAMQAITALCPTSPIGAVGVSLGGNQLLKLLGELPDLPHAASVETMLVKAVAVSPPIDLNACADNLDRWHLRFYSRYFIRKLRRRLPPRVQASQAWGNVRLHPHPRSMRQFDQQVTAPLAGFASATDYYTRASAMTLLHRIRCPTLVLSSVDDPIVPSAVIRRGVWSPSTTVEFSLGGGHLGFVGFRQPRWLESRITHYLTS